MTCLCGREATMVVVNVQMGGMVLLCAECAHPTPNAVALYPLSTLEERVREQLRAQGAP